MKESIYTFYCFIFSTLVFFVSFDTLAMHYVSDDEYIIEEFDKHRVHLLIIDPAKYEMKIVSSNNSVFGRQQVSDITKQASGDIGVNAGFFEIGANRDGMPLGILVIEGKFYSMQSKSMASLIKRGGKVYIEKLKPSLSVEIGDKSYPITRFNKFAVGKHSSIYNDAWGRATMSAYDLHKEIVIAPSGEVIRISQHGNNIIPTGGHVITLASISDISEDLLGKKAKFNWYPRYLGDQDCSAILGIPHLIENGKINSGINKTEANARTAFGITKEGQYIVAVVEHFNMHDIKNLTISDISEIINKDSLSDSLSDNLSPKEISIASLKKIVSKKLENNSNTIGMSTYELAEYLLSKDCVDAINLDGGGSSSLYLNGKFVNVAFGDIDEDQATQTHRAVANAIVFKRRGDSKER